MRCQQRKTRGYSKKSSDVLEADPAPPAGARSAPGAPAENLNRGRSKCVLSGAVHPPRPPRIRRGFCCVRTHKQGSLWPSGSELFDTIQYRAWKQCNYAMTRRFQRAHSFC